MKKIKEKSNRQEIVDRLPLIKSLFDQGKSYIEIAEIMKEKGVNALPRYISRILREEMNVAMRRSAVPKEKEKPFDRVAWVRENIDEIKSWAEAYKSAEFILEKIKEKSGHSISQRTLKKVLLEEGSFIRQKKDIVTDHLKDIKYLLKEGKGYEDVASFLEKKSGMSISIPLIYKILKESN